MHRSSVSVVLILWSCAVLAGSGFYRCEGDRGEPEFSQLPCTSVTGAVAVPAARGPARGEGVRESERRWLAQREKAGRSTRRGATAGVGRAADRDGERAARQRYQCQRKARSLEAVQARLRRGYRPAEGEQLRRRRAGYEDYIDAFCK